MPDAAALTADEIAALAPGADPRAAAAAPVAADGVRPYDLTAGERLPRGGLPALELVHERFARHLQESLGRFLRDEPRVEVGALRVPRFQAFLDALPVPGSLHLVRLEPLRGCALVVCDQALLSAVVDRLFGGTGDGTGQPAALSATGRRIAHRLLELTAAAYTRSWEPVHPVRMEPAATETEARFAAVAAPAEAVVATRFEIAVGEGGGALHVCIPYGALEPIRQLLQDAPRPAQGDGQPWLSRMTEQLRSASVELAAELAHGQATVRELLALQPGDFIALDRRDTLTVTVRGVPVFECDYGTVGDRYGLRIRQFLTPPPRRAAAS